MIQLINVCKSYGEVKVFENLNISFEYGSRTAIMGPSGCGKTTLFMILASLLKTDSGKITGLDGKKISAVFQEDRLCENLSLFANIKIVCKNNVRRGEILSAIESLHLGEFADKPIKKLSGGMKRRAAIIRALLADYDILLLDEPFNGLDDASKQFTADFILRMCKNRTLIMITHNKNDAELLGCSIFNFKSLIA